MGNNDLFRFLKSEGLLASPSEKTMRVLQDKSFQNDLRGVGQKASSEPLFQIFRTRGFKVMPSTHLNPMSEYYKCPSYDCRLQYADDFARRYAIFSDQVVIPDTFSERLTTIDNLELNFLKTNIDVIRHFAPLIDAKILTFTPSGARICQNCYEEKVTSFREKVESIIETTDFFILPSKNDIEIISKTLFSGTDMGWRIPMKELDPSHQKLFPMNNKYLRLKGKYLEILRPHLVSLFVREYKTTYVDAIIAKRETSLMLNGMELTHFCSSHAYSTGPTLPSHNEASKTFSLPYLSDLSMEQIVRLRADASESLSSLRCLLEEKVLLNPSGSTDSEIPGIVKDLREEIVSVKKKLLTKDIKKRKNFDGSLTILGTSMVLYGVATKTPSVTVAAIASLIASINIMNTNKNNHEQTECEIKTNPAYALLMAKEMLQCNDKA